MCSIVYLVLPPGADADAVGTLTEELRVGDGIGEDDEMQRDLTAAGLLPDSERVYRVVPQGLPYGCHCGWQHARFARLLTESLERGYAPAVGLLIAEDGWSPLVAKPGWTPPGGRKPVNALAFAEGQHDDDGVLYILEPDR